MKEDWFDRLMGSGSDLLIHLLEWAAHDVGPENKYGSPLEHAFATAVRSLIQIRYHEFGYVVAFNETEAEARINAADAVAHRPPQKNEALRTLATIQPQVVIGDYRVDFLILHGRGIDGFGGVVIECDGHDFHEKTKEQAAKDKSRDRVLQSMGFKVFRFTGAEVWKDPFGCAEQVLSHAQTLTIDASFARHLLQEGDTEGALKILSWS